MVEDYEFVLFIKELGRLLNDYQKCDDGPIKNEIYNEIQLLSHLIHPATQHAD